jgi:hypothetical protein
MPLLGTVLISNSMRERDVIRSIIRRFLETTKIRQLEAFRRPVMESSRGGLYSGSP